ncbi:MAG: UDP-N-acetylmuramoyl-L-alanine--D-glutamate ligase, partial [Actinomycetota bacterium]|nr:UDP-N-acetylmuramoyl-L-alanine--D-glutamate ligase [Actinomycetota bacterium]
MIDLKDKTVIVIGLARTGAAVARCCRGLGARVLVLEKSAEPVEPDQAASLLSLGIEVSYGDHDLEVLDGADLVIPSPGVPPANPLLRRALAAGLPVISEIELAFQSTDRPIIAVTGTNGKTTTVTLIGEILRAAGKAADVCGNIGRPMIDATGPDGPANAPLVVEVSSFQLEFTDRFKPLIGVLLNIAPDHLDWHQDMESYRDAKLKMFRHQTARDWAITGADCASLAAGTRGRKLTFGGVGGVFVERGWIRHDLRGPAVKVIAVDELAIRGEHNIANSMAAAAVAI